VFYVKSENVTKRREANFREDVVDFEFVEGL